MKKNDAINEAVEKLNILADALKKITKIKLDKVNVFDAIGMTTQEIKHSAFLAWLLSPDAPHKLGNTVLRLFLEHLIPHSFSDTMFEEKRKTNATILEEIAISSVADFKDFYDADDVKVNTEVVVFRDKDEKDGRIDIIIESVKANIVILIENKVFTSTHDNQLWRYEQGFEESTRKVIYVYLTPFGNTPEDFGTYRDNWCVCSYQTILHIARQVLKELPHTKANRRIKILLEDYIDMVNTEILQGNKKIRDLCRKILRENREALEILGNYTDQSEQIIAVCKSYLREKFGSDITFLGNTTTGTLDFYTSKAQRYFDKFDGGFEKNGAHKFLYQIRKAEGYKYCWYINKVDSTWSSKQRELAEKNGKSLNRKQDGEDIEKTSFCNLCNRIRFLDEDDLYTEFDESIKAKIIKGLKSFIREILKFESIFFTDIY